MTECITQLFGTDSNKKEYFYTKFENDIQLVFNEISEKEGFGVINVKSMIKKVNFFLKGDCFLPLRSSHASTFLNCKDILLQNLKKISYVQEVEISQSGNLIIYLNRTLVYEIILHQVFEYNERYGSIETNKSTLILVTEDKLKDFDKLRLESITNHLISFLTFNNVKIYCNKYNLYTKPLQLLNLKEEIACSENCSKSELLDEFKIKARESEWRKLRSDQEDFLCLDGKKYIHDNGLVSKYGRGINIVSLKKNKSFNTLMQVAGIKHIIDIHLPSIPDFMIHIVNYQQKFASYECGLVYEMLEKSESNQLYLDVQGTNIKFDFEICVEDFIDMQKETIINAMVHKYEANIIEDKAWSSRIEALVDSAIKYEFLKINLNTPLKLQFFHNSNSEKNLGIFMQYNFARLSNLFRKFESKVDEGYYDPLPKLSEINFKLLRLEEEWNLFNYVLYFPKLIQSILNSVFFSTTAKSRFPVNRIFIMLSNLCHDLSLYYSKIRILGSQQSELQKLMQARLWLLKSIHKILINAFVLLDIEGLDVM